VHPLISAWLRMRELEAVEPPRWWTERHAMWRKANDDAHGWFWDLMRAHRCR